MRRFLRTLVCLLLASAAEAQTVQNPTRVRWQVSVDQTSVVRYDVDLIRVSDSVVVQTLNLGKPEPDGTGTAEANINVMPVAFGTYVCVMRACTAAQCSVDSARSNSWDRAPGPPSGLQVQ